MLSYHRPRENAPTGFLARNFLRKGRELAQAAVFSLKRYFVAKMLSTGRDWLVAERAGGTVTARLILAALTLAARTTPAATRRHVASITSIRRAGEHESLNTHHRRTAQITDDRFELLFSALLARHGFTVSFHG
jgi:hypothetical protein